MAILRQHEPQSVILSPQQSDFAATLGAFLDAPRRVLEIGFGKGLFLLNASQAFPEKRFLGIEKAGRNLRFAAPRFSKRGVANVRLVLGYAEKILPQGVADNLFDEIYILHPDPWPKRRHAARRTLQAPFWELLGRKLANSGYILLLTDSADYFEQIRSEVAKVPALHTATGVLSQLPETNFTIKYKRVGRPLYHFLAGHRGQPFDLASLSGNFLFPSAP